MSPGREGREAQPAGLDSSTKDKTCRTDKGGQRGSRGAAEADVPPRHVVTTP